MIFLRILKDLESEFGSMFGLISKFVLAELRFTDRPRRVREAKRILVGPSAFSKQWVLLQLDQEPVVTSVQER